MKVIISGGELFNKGAQSMTLSVVSEVRKRYPNADISLLSAPDARRTKEELSQYRFSVLPWDTRMKLRKLPLLGMVFKNKYFSAEQEKQMWSAVAEADLAIDVSGFCLSSQFGYARIVDYLTNLYFFKKYSIKTVLFPQSFGPFDFKGAFSGVAKRYISSLMKYPHKVFAREMDGKNHLARLGITDNVTTALDTVLQTSKLEHNLVFNHINKVPMPEIENNAICIVPNQKVFVKNEGNALPDIYKSIIDKGVKAGKKVYLLRHSFEDLSIVRQLKAMFPDNDNVISLEEDFNALQLTEIINQMDFLVASRYHAVVHAYKCRKPCLVLGWAVKYVELTGHFSQSQYCFDVRSELGQEAILTAMQNLIDNHFAESTLIDEKSRILALGSLFDEAFDLV